MRAVLMDLDDTLYDEHGYVISGFREVSRYLAVRLKLDKNSVEQELVEIFNRNGRGNVFDVFVDRRNIADKQLVHMMVYLYRSHDPDIKLDSDVLGCLRSLRRSGYRLGIVTDGAASIQQRKIKALNLKHEVDAIIFTDELGRENWKPSVVPFRIILDLLNVCPGDAIYIGDNPHRDFKAPNELGMLSVHIDKYWRLRGGQWKGQQVDARCSIKQMSDVISILEG